MRDNRNLHNGYALRAALGGLFWFDLRGKAFDAMVGKIFWPSLIAAASVATARETRTGAIIPVSAKGGQFEQLT